MAAGAHCPIPELPVGISTGRQSLPESGAGDLRPRKVFQPGGRGMHGNICTGRRVKSREREKSCEMSRGARGKPAAPAGRTKALSQHVLAEGTLINHCRARSPKSPLGSSLVGDYRCSAPPSLLLTEASQAFADGGKSNLNRQLYPRAKINAFPAHINGLERQLRRGDKYRLLRENG